MAISSSRRSPGCALREIVYRSPRRVMVRADPRGRLERDRARGVDHSAADQHAHALAHQLLREHGVEPLRVIEADQETVVGRWYCPGSAWR
jgi:hypothetical protein